VPRTRRLSDANLVRRSQQGDRRAFSALVGRYDWRLRGLAFALLLDRAEMDAALGAAYLRSWRDIVRVGTKDDIAVWLYRHTYNACVDRLRLGRSAVGSGGRAPRGAGVPTGVVPVLAALPETERVALVLVDREGFTPTAAARIMGLPATMVDQCLAAGRARLAEHLATAAPAAVPAPAAAGTPEPVVDGERGTSDVVTPAGNGRHPDPATGEEIASGSSGHAAPAGDGVGTGGTGEAAPPDLGGASPGAAGAEAGSASGVEPDDGTTRAEAPGHDGDAVVGRNGDGNGAAGDNAHDAGSEGADRTAADDGHGGDHGAAAATGTVAEPGNGADDGNRAESGDDDGSRAESGADDGNRAESGADDGNRAESGADDGSRADDGNGADRGNGADQGNGARDPNRGRGRRARKRAKHAASTTADGAGAAGGDESGGSEP
jgi:RNA polymerase sigma-70 factor (ECF subfamily)